MKYEYIPHTADIQFRAYGNTIEEAFSNSALAFSNSISKDHVKNNISKKIKVTGMDMKNLLYNFIEELIIYFDSEKFLLNDVEKISIEENTKKLYLDATVNGDYAGKYNISSNVKAITYSDMKIEHKDDRWEIVVTLDI